MNNFEETFSQWEFELYKFERDNGQALPESVKIAVILNEAKGPLQQHLRLLAGQSPTYNTVRTTIMEYYRATTAFNKLKQQTSSSVNTNHGGGTAPMDISAIKGKGKGYKGKGKYKGERQGKGYGRYKGERQGKGYGRHKGKEKGYKEYGKGPVGQGNPFSMKGQQKQEHKGRRKGAKGKRAQDKCYRCGQQGHIAREAPTATTEQHDTTYPWYEDPHGYDHCWWHSMSHQGQQLSLPAPYTAATHNTPTVQRISGVHCNEPIIIAHVHEGNAGQAINYSDIMVSTRVATHVCPPWFAQEFPIQTLTADKEPQLRTATDDEIKLYGYKWVYMRNVEGQPVVIPFYVCDVPQPIVSVSRLEEQGFELTFKEGQPTVRHAKGFNTTLVKTHGLYYVRTTVIPIPPNYTLQIQQTSEGTVAVIAPTTITTQGPEPIVGGNSDYWTYNNEGYLVRVHKRMRKALFSPYKTCPVPTNKLENYRRTIVTRLDEKNEDFEEQFQSLSPQQQKRVLQGQAWTGESWFKLKPGTTMPEATTTHKTQVDNKPSTRTTSSTSSSASLHFGQELQRKTTHKTQVDNKPSTRTTSLMSSSTPLHPGQELQRKTTHKTQMDNKPSTGTTSLTSSSAPLYTGTTSLTSSSTPLHPGQELQRKTATMTGRKMDSKPSRDITTSASASSKQEASTESTTFTPTHPSTTEASADTQLVPTSKSTTALQAQSTLEQTEAYRVQDSHMWTRPHIQPHDELYIPQQTQHEPDPERRVSFMNPKDGLNMTRFDDQWTSQQRRQTDKTWKGSTNFEEETGKRRGQKETAYQEEYSTDEEDTQQATKPEEGIKAAQQPTEQESIEHNLTRLPHRALCPICFESKVKANNRPTQKTSKLPVIQCDFAYIKGKHDKQVTPVSTLAVTSTATIVEDEQRQFTYLTQCIQMFLLIEEYLVSLLEATARTIGSNMTARQLPAYISKSQGIIGLLHRTIFNQIRRLTSQLNNNYKLNITNINHPWQLIRHAAYLLNRYAIHNDGNTSYFRRWNKEHKTPLLKFGEAVHYMVPHQTRFLGKDTMTSESIIGIQGKIIRTRTIGRQIEPDKDDGQLMGIINVPPWTPATPTEVLQPTMLVSAAKSTSTRERTITETHRTEDTTQTGLQSRYQQPQQTATTTPAQRETIVASPKATAPVNPSRRQPLPLPKRQQPEEIMQGSDPKQQRIAERQQPLQRPQDEQTPATRMTRRGETMTATSCEDEQEAETERILLEPTVYCTESLDKKTIKGTKYEIEHLLSSGVYSEVNINDLRPEQQATIIESRLVLRNEEDKIRARIEDKGYTEQIEDADTIYASTPIFCILRILLTLAMAAMIHSVRNIKAGDTSVAFLQSLAAISKLVQKAMRKERQNLAQILQDLDKRRLKSEPNVHMKRDGTACILVHKDDLLFIGQNKTVNELFTTIQSPHEPGQTMPPQGRGITNKGDHEISLSKDYTTTMLEEAGMTTYETATTPGTAANKASNDDNEDIPVNKEEHALYRIVGKLQRMTHTRPDLSFVTQELATANIRRFEKSKAHTESPTSFKGLQAHSTSENNTRKQQGSQQRSQEEQQFKKSIRRRAQ